MPQILIFNLTVEKQNLVEKTAAPLGLPCRIVSRSEQGKTISVLTGREQDRGNAVPAETFSNEMLLMDGLNPAQFRILLDCLRMQRVSIPLKAIVTEHNLAWTAAQLHRELAAEHAALTGQEKQLRL